LSHRLRLKINTKIATETSIAELHGGFINHKNEIIEKNWPEKFVEKPVNIFNFDQLVGMKNEKNGVFLFAKGMKEYEKVADSLIVTLMATTGQLGKPNLLWRPGRASGDTTSIGHLMTPTPLAQENGLNEFEFGILSEKVSDPNNLAKKADRWFSPSISYQKQNLNLFVNRLDNKIWDIEFDEHLNELKTIFSGLSIDLPVSVSAIYPAYTVKNAYVIRLSNFSENSAVNVRELKAQGYQVANALEEIITDSEFEISPSSMMTLIKKYD
jgi:alpha-mannosidase